MLSNQFFQLRPVLLLLFLCFLSPISFSKSSELNSLLQFKSAVQNPDTNHVFSSWTQANSLCNFTGIACNSNGLVTEINLPQQNLHGILPFDSICSLQSLEKLSLGSNFLYGTITEDLKNCTSLQHLDLGLNKFSGKVPDLSPLSKLEFLNLNNSGFSGPFPWSSLENLTSLTFLSLGDNFFEPSTFPVEVFKLEKLYWLYLSNCSLTGQIPEGLGNLTQLINLELSCNQLTGEIPADIGKLKNLWQLELYSNSLTGKLPVGFGNLTSLKNLDMSRNNLQGNISEVGFLTNIVSIQLFMNQFTGEVPEEIGEFKNLSNFSLYRNKFTGPLPQKLGSLGEFFYIDVAENFLTGPIPPDMCKNGILDALIVMQNKFTGGIPESYANCLSLRRVRVSNNSLSGVVPAGIWGLPKLSTFDLSMNQFEGPVASNVGNAKSLAQLFLNNNRFSGELPLAISEASSLVSILLSSNQFSGQIPETIGGLKTLGSIYLDENMFSGYIPDSLGSCVSLSEINLSGNKLSGNIPASLGHLPNLNSLNLSNNELSGEIPTSLSSLTLSLLDLSNNQLIGHIPDSLSILAFSTSFNGNPGLCSQNLKHFQPCSSGSRSRSHLGTMVSCLIAGAVILLLVLVCCLCVKLRHKNLDSPLKPNSWDMKPYHILTFTEKEIIDGIKKENQIGKGGSGNVYRVELTDGKELAVKHIWMSDSGDRKNWQSSSAMLTKRNIRSAEYEAEVATLSSVRHINVVKLYCSITDSTISEALKEDAIKVMRIAVHCTSKLPSLRPSMRMVVQMLEEAKPCKLTNITVNKECQNSSNESLKNTGKIGALEFESKIY
ncbi:receptor-like protein kinase 7, partial [Quercus suber]